LFKNVKPAPYSFLEIAIFILFIGLVVIVPQFWLYKNMPLFIIYWAMMVFAGIDIKCAVCTQCENGYCPSNKRFKGFFMEYNK
jgi:prepilin signal peptidase PulO-like enzyme (type II secretory pathway)